MANSSEKKNEKTRQKQIKQFQAAILIVTGVYFLNALIRGYLFDASTLGIFAFFTLVNYGCYASIQKNLSLGLDSDSYDYQLDVLGINALVQIGTCFWSGFWYVYLIVPGFIVWKLSSFCFNRLSSNDQENEDEDESKLTNTQRKKREREREGKEKVVYKKAK